MSKVVWTSVCAATVLAACGGGGGSRGNGNAFLERAGNAPATQILAADAGNAGDALSDDVTLTASERTSSAINDGDMATSQRLDSVAAIRRNGSGGVDVIMDGQTYVFTASDLQPDGNGYQTEEAGVWLWDADTFAEGLDPANSGFSLVFDTYHDSDSGGINRFMVVGTETASADLPVSGSATYDGWLRLRAIPASGDNDWSAQVREVRGDLGLTADFGTGSISGVASNLAHRVPEDVDPTRSWNPFDGSLIFGEADVSGNGFSGQLTSDAAFAANWGSIDPMATWSGTFFGPAADEVGGGITYTVDHGAAGQMTGWGVWQAGAN